MASKILGPDGPGEPLRDWEIVAYGSPRWSPGAQPGDHTGWHDVTKGASPPTDADISAASEVTIRHGENYYTIHMDFFEALDEFTDYIDNVLLPEYKEIG